MKTFSLEIVTPIKVIIEESVKYLRCPGVDGSFGVMHKHRNGVFALDTGEVKIETNNGTSWFATSGGFAEITEEKVELFEDIVCYCCGSTNHEEIRKSLYQDELTKEDV